jgi:hypothetical protein
MSDGPQEHYRYRTILHAEMEDGQFVRIEHIFEPEGASACEDCGGPAHDPGEVGLVIGDGDGIASLAVTPEMALLIANRLTRAASLVLESGEELPDVDREMARFGAPGREKA